MTSYSTPALVASAGKKPIAALRASFKRLERYLMQQLAKLHTDGGLLVRDKFNIQHIRKTARALREQFHRLGMQNATTELIHSVEGLAEFVLKEAKDLDMEFEEDGAMVPADHFTDVSEEQIRSLKEGLHRGMLAFEQRVSSELEELIRGSLTGQLNFDKLAKTIQTQLDLREDQVQTMMSTSLSAFHRQTRAEHAQEAGVVWFLYDGPRDDRNRDFCAHFVGTRVTIQILRKNADRFGRNPKLIPVEVLLGGHRCRHELMPLVEQSEIDKYEVGPRKRVGAPAKIKPTKKEKEKKEVKKTTIKEPPPSASIEEFLSFVRKAKRLYKQEKIDGPQYEKYGELAIKGIKRRLRTLFKRGDIEAIRAYRIRAGIPSGGQFDDPKWVKWYLKTAGGSDIEIIARKLVHSA